MRIREEYSAKRIETDLLVVIGITTPSLDQTIKLSLRLENLLGPTSLLLMFPNKLVTLRIKHLECTQDLAQVLFRFNVDFLDCFVGIERKDGDVGIGRSGRAKDGNRGNDSDSTFRADEQLFEIESCLSAPALNYLPAAVERFWYWLTGIILPQLA